MNLPRHSRRLLVRISSKQLHSRNHIPWGDGKELEIIDDVNPNNWSVEEAIIEQVPERCKFFTAGDKVLIDFAVLTEGMNPEMQLYSQTRIVEKTEDYTIYWASYGGDEVTATEVLAIIIQTPPPIISMPAHDTIGEGDAIDREILKIYGLTTDNYKSFFEDIPGYRKGFKLVPYPDTIIIPQAKKSESFEQKGLLYVPAGNFESRESTFKEKVLFSNVEGVKPGDTVWVQGGQSIPINSPDWKVEYVKSEGILAID